MIWMIISILFVLVCLVLIGISVYVGWQLTHPQRKPVDDSPDNYGLHRENITFPSRTRDVCLDGWFLKSPYVPTDTSPITVIMCHGYAGTRLEKGLPRWPWLNLLSKQDIMYLCLIFGIQGIQRGK